MLKNGAVDPLETAREVWEYLVKEGGLQPDSWDRGLVEEIARLLGLPGEADPSYELDAAGITTEQLICALFGALEPFAQMMTELLRLFQAHNVTHTDEVAEIEFDFEEVDEKFNFDLDAFRTARTEWVKALVTVPEPDWPGHAWFDLLTAVAGEAWYFDRAGSEDVVRWLVVYEDRQWPEPLSLWPTGVEDLDARLQTIWQLWLGVLAASTAAAPNRDELLRQVAAARSEEDVELVAALDNDDWLGQMADRLFALVEHVAEADDDAGARAGPAVERIDAFFEIHPLTTSLREGMVERLADVLELPVWQRRHELYSAWVLTAIADAVPGRVELLPDEGVLRFPFRPTRMARIHGCDPPLEIWSELRTSLSDPLGASRKEGVQPDYSITEGWTEGETKPPAEASYLEVEAKQYERPSNRNFGYALRDYAKARPKALVTLLSHGRLREKTVLKYVEAEYQSRTRAIGELHPRSSAARTTFRDLVAQRFDSLCTDPAEGEPELEPEVAEAVAWCVLSWNAPPADLDLHLFVDAFDSVWQIYYASKGRPDRYPYAWLARDVTEPGGTEQVAVTQAIGAIYTFAVKRYSKDRSLAGCGAEATVGVPGHANVVVRCPDAGEGDWWVVGTWRLGEPLEVVNAISSDPPLHREGR